jgi:hypothetical protein
MANGPQENISLMLCNCQNILKIPPYLIHHSLDKKASVFHLQLSLFHYELNALAYIQDKGWHMMFCLQTLLFH